MLKEDEQRRDREIFMSQVSLGTFQGTLGMEPLSGSGTSEMWGGTGEAYGKGMAALFFVKEIIQ